MTTSFSHEAGIKQLQNKATRGDYIGKKLLKKIEKYSDDYSVIASEDLKVVDISQPNHNPFRWSSSDCYGTHLIIDTTGNFGPHRLVELELDPDDEYRYEFRIKRVYTIEHTSDGCWELESRDKDAEGFLIVLNRGEVFTNTQFHSMSTLLNHKDHWEDRPVFQLYSLVQYWAFHHKAAVDWLHQEEVYDA